MDPIRELVGGKLKKLRKAARHDDEDSLHDVRTATRALLAIVRAYGDALPRKAAHRAEKHMRRLLDATAEVVEAAREQFGLAEGRYEAGVGNVIELEDAILTLATAQNDQVQAEYNLATAPGEAGEHAASTADDARAPFGATKRAAVNPFGEVKPAPAANPFGDARPSGKENPFGGGEPARDEGEQEPARRPRNPFGD